MVSNVVIVSVFKNILKTFLNMFYCTKNIIVTYELYIKVICILRALVSL